VVILVETDFRLLRIKSPLVLIRLKLRGQSIVATWAIFQVDDPCAMMRHAHLELKWKGAPMRLLSTSSRVERLTMEVVSTAIRALVAHQYLFTVVVIR
jgi:hypothetical protein